MRTLIVLLVTAAMLPLLAPAASAGPNCFQVYPWSRLCEGDVPGFIDGLNLPCDPISGCIAISQPHGGPTVDCIQAIPWSYLCSGNVGAFVEYYTGPILA